MVFANRSTKSSAGRLLNICFCWCKNSFTCEAVFLGCCIVSLISKFQAAKGRAIRPCLLCLTEEERRLCPEEQYFTKITLLVHQHTVPVFDAQPPTSSLQIGSSFGPASSLDSTFQKVIQVVYSAPVVTTATINVRMPLI